MTKDDARAFVLTHVTAGPITAGQLLALAPSRESYRAIDRALQHHRRAGRIAFRGRMWVKGPAKP